MINISTVLHLIESGKFKVRFFSNFEQNCATWREETLTKKFVLIDEGWIMFEETESI